ncbi:PIN domain-containing protein [Candidatus Woesearchaeota archaeon]|nr:PIN domain-containing protein [Candidatus Woesearchaeota archaeon]
MDLIVDANILFAALIKESASYDLLFVEHFHLYAPEFIFKEIEKHRAEILKKTERTPDDFRRLLDILKRRLNLVPFEELVPFVRNAEETSPDPDDMVYFALALKLNIPIWSNDKKLKEQEEVKVYSTEEIMKLV